MNILIIYIPDQFRRAPIAISLIQQNRIRRPSIYSQPEIFYFSIYRTAKAYRLAYQAIDVSHGRRSTQSLIAPASCLRHPGLKAPRLEGGPSRNTHENRPAAGNLHKRRK
ncbi:hypothetical protein [Roseateles sp. LKC17W]|uniref:Uncharacterized protein n=1 Tax=Pelomonas margarita TaxID=3299031 RepID=A0ABW7FII0_9BURK